jgi:hypothetical protein
MSEIVTLTCPSCGGKLEISPDIDRLKCVHCGQEQLILHDGNQLLIRPLQDSISLLQQATSRNASEQAIQRIKAEIQELEDQKSPLLEKKDGYLDLLKAHKKRKQDKRWVWITPLLILSVYFGYQGLIQLGKMNETIHAVEGFLFLPFICWSTIILLIISWFLTVFESIFKAGPKPPLQEVERLILEVDRELEVFEASKREKQEEISRHQGIVSRGV